MARKIDYDEGIIQHYKRIADEHKLSSTSTMSDKITRRLETDAILQFVWASLGADVPRRAVIMDVGCGNGYTLEVLATTYRGHNYIGIEKSDELRKLAQSRFRRNKNVRILKGDIRKRDFAGSIKADILICQRVLINLLNRRDQLRALGNIISTVKPPSIWTGGGTLLFLESFKSPLMRLNKARTEFDLSPIPQPKYNLYLPDDFFKVSELKDFYAQGLTIPPNFLSTHYYVSRILHASQGGFERNSEFVKFFSGALNNTGDYSPLKLYMFQRKK